VHAVKGATLDLKGASCFQIIGPNGAGKTTLFNLISGLDLPDAGSVTLFGRTSPAGSPEKLAGMGMARTFQHGRVFGNLSASSTTCWSAPTRGCAAVRPRCRSSAR
jgi:branched-chain amino acid transport system ATP-binding protein